MSNKTEHTPGPWHIWEYDATAVHGPEDMPTPITQMSRARGLEETEANARLTASAPDLLAALEFLVDNARHPTWIGMNEARAAIAKARGK